MSIIIADQRPDRVTMLSTTRSLRTRRPNRPGRWPARLPAYRIRKDGHPVAPAGQELERSHD